MNNVLLKLDMFVTGLFGGDFKIVRLSNSIILLLSEKERYVMGTFSDGTFYNVTVSIEERTNTGYWKVIYYDAVIFDNLVMRLKSKRLDLKGCKPLKMEIPFV